MSSTMAAAVDFSFLGLIRFFLLIHGFFFFQLEASHLLHRNLEAAVQTSSQDPTYRTSFHFQPPQNWMNDPNGPMIYKGFYHLFYQYNPKGAGWGNIVWAHSTSKDLINWIPHPHAIYPSQESDINGCWSGSATILPNGNPAILYTGINPQNQQVQNLATPKNSSDPFLIEWVKSPENPMMAPTVQNGINSSSFRDPTTSWRGPDGMWRVIIGNKKDRRGIALLYHSKDFVQWTKADHPLHSSDDTGMWECPDFYPVPRTGPYGLETSRIGPEVKHVLKYSLDDTKHDHYTVGTYDYVKDVYVPDEGSLDNATGLRYDYGKFYASKTFFDSLKNRRILWGWINESLPEPAFVKQGWSGVQAIPRMIWMDKLGKQLVQWPVPEIEKLRSNRVRLSRKSLPAGSVVEISGLTAAQADVEVWFGAGDLSKAENMDPSWTDPQMLCSQKGASVRGGIGPFGLQVLAAKNHSQEHTAVFFRIFKAQTKYVVLMCSDQSRSSLKQEPDKTTYGAFLDVDPVRQQLSLRTLIDNSIIESFGGRGKVCITSRVYPTLAVGKDAHLYAFNYGSQSVKISRLNAWSMKKAVIN